MCQRNQLILNLVLCLLLASLFQACVPFEKLVNFHDETPEDLIVAQYVPEIKKITIQNDDILSITVSTFDSTAARVFNKPVSASGADGSFIGQGYLVDEDGFIEFPVLGKLKMKGLTREIAKDTIKNRLLTYLRDPVVDVRFLNLHVSVMGEVKSPNLYTFPDERFTILEALTLAGDMTDFADRSKVMVIREHDKVREFGVVDLSSARAFESPYFYLTQNDVVYVKPIKEKTNLIQDPISRILAFTGIAVSLATVVIALTR
ncbi:MAG: polysaccharide biosynthesis/export family protein [Lewinellaceae bacterium]|nr:polysaccharide biosynthesis/export family protein [Saprospiraceae bacterium]MCB9338330.1 polysaccharide biosynthesis/export family protein [Lewinellaceae bacterium]